MLKEGIAFVILSIYASTCSAVCVTQPVAEGGITDIDINDPGVISAAYNAHNIAWEDVSDLKNLGFVIKSAKSQIVTGIKYYLTIVYSGTILCDFEIIYLSWINQYSLVGNRCSFVK